MASKNGKNLKPKQLPVFSLFNNSLLHQRTHVLVSEMSAVLEPDINRNLLFEVLYFLDVTFMKFGFLKHNISIQNSLLVCFECVNEVTDRKVPCRVTDRCSSDEDSLLHPTLHRLCRALLPARLQPRPINIGTNTNVIFNSSRLHS